MVCCTFIVCATRCTFGFLQFILPAVTLASDELPLFQASLQRAESVHVEPSVLPWENQTKAASVLHAGYSEFAESLLACSPRTRQRCCPAAGSPEGSPSENRVHPVCRR